jgi:hypothetical protein
MCGFTQAGMFSAGIESLNSLGVDDDWFDLPLFGRDVDADDCDCCALSSASVETK